MQNIVMYAKAGTVVHGNSCIYLFNTSFVVARNVCIFFLTKGAYTAWHHILDMFSDKRDAGAEQWPVTRPNAN